MINTSMMQKSRTQSDQEQTLISQHFFVASLVWFLFLVLNTEETVCLFFFVASHMPDSEYLNRN